MLSTLSRRLMSTNIKINGKAFAVPDTKTILDVCRENNIYVPTLCHHPRLPESGTCRLCLVDVDGVGSMLPACRTPVWEGMEVNTSSDRIDAAVSTNLQMIANTHCFSCATCASDGDCELQDLVHLYDVPIDALKAPTTGLQHSVSLTRDPSKCVACGRCVQACSVLQDLGVWQYTSRAHHSLPSTEFGVTLDNTACINCGQCATFCPTGALTERDEVSTVLDAIRRKSAEGKTIVIQTAPAVRVALSEAFGMAPGTISTGKMVAALRKVGFDHVFDTNFTADLTILEEGTELLGRLGKNGPMFTSCCPGWVNLVEKHYPEFIPNLSSCKSPQGMMGALVKHHWAAKAGVSPDDVFLVSAMPCTAKKDEAARPQLDGDVDVVLTTRELARLIKLHRPTIAFPSLEPEAYDSPLGASTGAGTIFGTTGGVMEAALRTVHDVVTGEPLPDDALTLDGAVRPDGESLRTATVPVGDVNVRVAVVHGLRATKELLGRIKAGEEFDFVEVMACPGGCVGGGGNPRSLDADIIAKRAAGLYLDDEQCTVRKSHENEAVMGLYRDYLGEPNGEKSHHLLHTTYADRK